MRPQVKNQFVRDNLITIVSHSLIAIKGFLLIPVIIKFAGVQLYGSIILLQSLLGFLFGISSFGIGIKMRRHLPSEKNALKRSELFYKQFIFRLLSILLIIIISIIFGDIIKNILFNDGIEYSNFIISFFLITTFFFAQTTDYFRYTSRISKMSIMTLISPAIYIVMVLFLTNLRMLSINSIIGAQSLSLLIVSFPGFIVILKENKFRLFRFFKNIYSEIQVGLPLVINFVMDFVLAGIDRYIIAIFFSVAFVGYYNVGYQLGSLILILPKAMGTVLPQLMSKSIDKERVNEAISMFSSSIKLYLFISIPFCFGSLVLGMPILNFISNQEVASNARFVFPLVALGSVFFGLSIIISDVLLVFYKTKKILKINLIGAIFNILSNIILLYFFKSISAAAITTFFSYLILYVFSNKILKHIWNTKIDNIFVLKSIFSSLFMTLIISLVSKILDPISNNYFLLLEIILGIFSYFFLMFVLRAISISDILRLKNVIQ